MKKFFLITQYLQYILKAKSAHGVHSPFVFDFIHDVLKDKRHYYAFDAIRQLRQAMYQDKTLLQIEDFGAGSHKQNHQQRKVKDIARTAGRNEKFGQLLFRIVNKYKPQNILELGTSMGLGTSYLALANGESKVVSIEGSPEIASQASAHFAKLNIQNVIQKVGNFDKVLVDVLNEMQHVDLLFVDGNHRMKPTLQYFNEAKPYLHPASIVIFDDIHWSEEMHEAWQQIKNDTSVKCSIDLFYFGIVFFQTEFKEKQDFVLKY
jgi:predicted O-methyltransferase YrrM